jgi:hypothetical protein
MNASGRRKGVRTLFKERVLTFSSPLMPVTTRHLHSMSCTGMRSTNTIFWVVEFWKRLPPEVAAETPGNVLIIVEEVSRRILQAYPGWQ